MHVPNPVPQTVQVMDMDEVAALLATHPWCITLHQPFAQLIVTGWKRYETRGWKPVRGHRGTVIIHSAQIWTQKQRDECTLLSIAQPVLTPVVCGTLPRGVLLGAADITDVIPVEDMGKYITPLEYAVGEYDPGRFAWRLENVRVFAQPIPAIGNQKMWRYKAA